MSLYRGKDNKVPYYRWGKWGIMFYYTAGNKASRDRAKQKAIAQGRDENVQVARRS